MHAIPGHKGNANKNHPKYSTSLLLELLPSRTLPPTNVGEDAGKRNSHTLLGECNLT
jgi:hypothetical protein